MGGWPRPARQSTAERLDAERLPRRALAGNLRDLGRANRYLGGQYLVRRYLWPAIAALPPDEPVRVLDVGTGGADLPLALARWARREGRCLRVLGLDRGATVLAYAAEQTRDEPAIGLV